MAGLKCQQAWLQRPCLPPSRALQQRASRLAASRHAGGRSRGLRCAAQLRPFAGSGASPQEAARQPQPAAAVASQAATVDAAPPVAEQQKELAALLQRLGKAATYGDKVRQAACRW